METRSSIKYMEGKEGLDALFLYATEGILVVNEQGDIIRANPSAEKLFGYAKEKLIGIKIEALVPRRYAGKHSGYREKFGKNPHARSMGAGMELYGLKKDGSEFPVEISLSPYSTPEGKFVIGFVVDITIRKQAEEKMKTYSAELEKQVKDRTLILEEAIGELEKTKKDLNTALDKEKELNELKSRFVSMASHEFRTPLTTMMSSLSLVSAYEEKKDSTNHGKHVSKIKASINILTDILNDFLSVSKLEEGKVENKPEELNIKSFINEIAAEMQSLAIEGQKIDYVHQGDEVVILDKKLVKHILFNLTSNALKFSPEGGTVTIRSEITGHEIKISVKDQGIGISKEDQKHLFERFFRGRNATHIQGTGLGLNIVARYVELMGGEIDLKSEEKKGSAFIITIPR
jgi:PAS domain S-box-containing protein